MVDNNDFATKFEIDGSDGRAELQRIFGDLKKLIPAAKQAGDAVDASAGDMAKQYTQVASAIERVEMMMDRLQASQARKKSSINVSDARDASATSKFVYDDDANRSKAALAATRAQNEVEKGKIAIRQQANRDLESEQRALRSNAQIEELTQKTSIAAEREKQRQIQQEETARARVAAVAARQAKQEQDSAERQGALYARYLEEQEKGIARNAALQQKASAQAVVDAQRLADVQKAAVLDRARTERAAAGTTAAAQRAAANPGTERTSALSAERAGSLHDVSQINATRYALYDVAATATLVGTAIAGIGATSIVAATKAESAFAQVRRTMDDGGMSAEQFDAQADKLRGTLLDLTTQMPTSFEDIAGIAQLGGQLGIANQDLDEFASTVTKFAATTNVSTETTAESFGRLGNLLKVPASEFENLGSSIYEVGIKSAATESEILSVSQQIAGAASAYDFTASSVVGLSSTFASLGIAPEAARSAVTGLFGDIESGAAKGGDAMEPFAKLIGETGEEAAALWKSDPSQFFDKLVKGLAEAKKAGNLDQAISSIGANDRREVNLLQRLAGNSKFLSEQLKIANDAYREGTSLSKGYEEVANTLAAKLTELWNAVQKLAIEAGGPLLQALTPVVDFLKTLVVQLSDANPVILSIVSVLALLVGGFILFKSAQAAVLAGILALRFVLQQLGDASGGTGAKVASLKTQFGLLRAELTGVTAESRAAAAALTTTGVAGETAGRGMKAFGLASKAVGWAGLALLVGQVTGALLEANRASISAWQGINKVSTAAQGAKLSMKEVADSFTQAKQQIYEFQGGNITDVFANALGSATGTNDYVKQAQQEIDAVDNRLAKMASDGNGEKAAEQVKLLGLSSGEIASFLPNYSDALKAASDAQDAQGASASGAASGTDEYADSFQQASDAVDALFSKLNSGSDFAGALQKLYSGVYDVGTSFSYMSESGRSNLANLQDAMLQTVSYAQATGQSTSDAIASMFIRLAQQGVNVKSILADLESSPVVLKGDIDMSAVYSKINAAIGSGINGSAKKVASSYKPIGALDIQIGSLALNAPKAANGLSGVGTAAKNAAKDAADAAKEVRTLNDYVSDLGTVFSDATQYRFGVTDSLDDISSQWKSITDQIAENNKAVAENKKKNKESFAEYKQDIKDTRVELAKYRADLAGLKAELTQKKYFLKIAVQYGDNLRGDAIKSDIADLNANIADKNNDIAKAQKDLKTPFEATTVSIDKQKKSLGDLYRSYQDAVQEYARSGLSQDELGRKTEALRQDFIRQATQAGYSKASIDKYSGAFDDLTYAIRHVPRNITVRANTNPAIQALNDFLAKANKAKAKASVTAPGAGSAGYNAAKAFTSNFDHWMANWSASFNQTKQFIDSTTKDIDKIVSNVGKITDGIGKIKIPNAFGLATGGFVPGKNAFPIGGFVPGPKPADRRRDNMLGMTPSGAVALQGGEPIINNAARSKYGDSMFNAINSLNYQPNVIRPQVTVQGGGGYDGPVELSAYDRSMLAAIISAVQQGMTIDSSAVQNAANGANVVDSKRRRG